MTDFDDLDGKLDTVLQDIAGMTTKVDRADRELFGNGRPGLGDRMSSVKTEMAAELATVRSQVGMLLKLGAALGGASLTTLLGILAALVLGG